MPDSEQPNGRGRCSSKTGLTALGMKARVTVTLKNGVLDPQGKAIEGALARARLRRRRRGPPGQGHRDRARREPPMSGVRKQLKEMCEKLLANTVIENYNIEIR